MSRSSFLDLAASGHAVPIGTDLVLHQQDDIDAILLDGERLGAVVAESARTWDTPLAFPLMDLKLEKSGLLGLFGVPEAERDSFHFQQAPPEDQVAEIVGRLPDLTPTPRMAANISAVRHIAEKTDLLPIGMSIGPFSLTTKLMAEPITPVFLAGSGMSAEDDPDVGLLETCLALSVAYVLRYLRMQLEAGAKAVFIAEPATNQVFISPRQVEGGSNVFERFAMKPNQDVAQLLAENGAELLFHCCGEITDEMLRGFASLQPALLSLGASRDLTHDASIVSTETVLYGNLPSKRFYSAKLSGDEVERSAAELVAGMRATGQPFILGTECDVLFVAGSGEEIRSKVDRLLAAARN